MLESLKTKGPQLMPKVPMALPNHWFRGESLVVTAGEARWEWGCGPGKSQCTYALIGLKKALELYPSDFGKLLKILSKGS